MEEQTKYRESLKYPERFFNESNLIQKDVIDELEEL